MDGKEYIGCCGAYCKTCGAFARGKCKGCKLGFDGDRNINKTGCNVKKCCFRDNTFETCADCSKLDSCNYMENWYKKGHGKYRIYKKYIDFIKENGYLKFIEIANNWKGHFGEMGANK
jgi:hypothetical protein